MRVVQVKKWQRRRRDDGFVIKVWWPECGIDYALDHEIDSSGMVTPSVECPTEGCDFHHMIRLVGWGND